LEGQYKPNKNLSKEDQERDKAIFNKLKKFYNSCMNVKKSYNRKELTYKMVTELKLRENQENYDTVEGLTNLLGLIHDYDPSFIFSLGDETIENEMLITIDGCNSNEDRECYEDPDCGRDNASFMEFVMEDLYDLSEKEISKRANSFYKIT